MRDPVIELDDDMTKSAPVEMLTFPDAEILQADDPAEERSCRMVVAFTTISLAIILQT